MSSRNKLLIVLVAILIVIIVAIGLVYSAAKKGTTGPEKEPAVAAATPPPHGEAAAKNPKTGRFQLGEFVAASRDEEAHYIKLEVELEYTGVGTEKDLELRKGEMRDAINRILMKMTIQRAKEDYIDGFLHKDIEKRLNELLGTTSGGNGGISQVFIPVFLIN